MPLQFAKHLVLKPAKYLSQVIIKWTLSLFTTFDPPPLNLQMKDNNVMMIAVACAVG